MSHLYPLASNAKDALDEATVAALTRYEAEALADGLEVVRLETEWITPDSEDVVAIMDAADAGPGRGFVQRYENETGAPVLAVTYWKLSEAAKKKPAPKPEPKPAQEEDHTDDLYFRAGRTKPARKRGRKKYVDPRQIDMFPTPIEPED